MKRLSLLALLAAALYASDAPAVPFHGCSFYNSTLHSATSDCSDASVDFGGCWIVHCLTVICISYPGAQWTNWNPEWFIEVTNRAKKSAFVGLDTPLMSTQMMFTGWYWGEDSVAAGTSERPRSGSESSMYFGRVLPVGYGPIGFTWATPGIFDVGTPGPPICFQGVSEMLPDLWRDTASSPDRILAGLWAPLTAPVCTLGAAVSGAISLAGVSIPTPQPPTFDPCAYPFMPVDVTTLLALTSPTALNPLAQCMGVLGGLYPRTGVVDGDVYTASQRVAWRTASLTQDIFRSTNVAVQPEDKWQMVWPNAASHRCFSPGSIVRPTTFDPTSLLARWPGYDTAGTSGMASTEFIYAVWRKRQVCMEPWLAPAAWGELLFHDPLVTAICMPVNALQGP